MKTFLEELVGEIEDEHDVDEDEIIENIDGSFSADPKVEIEEFTQYFNLEIDPLIIDAETLGGLVINELGVLPKGWGCGEYRKFKYKSYTCRWKKNHQGFNN